MNPSSPSLGALDSGKQLLAVIWGKQEWLVSAEARPEGQSFFHSSPASALPAEELMDAPVSTSLSQGAAQQSTRTPTGLITVITLGGVGCADGKC